MSLPCGELSRMWKRRNGAQERERHDDKFANHLRLPPTVQTKVAMFHALSGLSLGPYAIPGRKSTGQGDSSWAGTFVTIAPNKYASRKCVSTPCARKARFRYAEHIRANPTDVHV